MKLLDFIYNDTTISFEQTGNDDVMVNATEMAKVFGKRISVFLKSDYVKEFILELELTPFGDSLEPLKHEQIIITRNGVNTYFHRILALKFAAWLDTKFEIWVWKTIDTIILGHYKEQRDATIEKIKAEKAAREKRSELLAKYPDFAEFIELIGKVDEADKRRIAAIKASTNQLKLEFFSGDTNAV